MKSKKGFTLIETLATIILLGVILMIAVPSITNVVDANNRRRLKEAGEMFVVLGKQKLQIDTSIEYPETDKVVVLFLDSIDKKQLENIVDKNVKLGNSTADNPSKVVFSYDSTSNKWINAFVVLYDTKGNAAYTDDTTGKVISGKETGVSDPYSCTPPDKGKVYCYE